MWIQYVVGYDKQEQRSLATTLRNRLYNYRRALSEGIDNFTAAVTEWWRSLAGGTGAASSWLGTMVIALLMISFLGALALFYLLVKRARRFGFWRGLRFWHSEAEGRSVIDFYERMTSVLAERGMVRAVDETPLEFATATGMTEAMKITRAYNRVRYGEQPLSSDEAEEIDKWLREMEDRKNQLP
jgi:hypothetical protein